MQTNDVERLKAEIRYLRNCLLEAYNAIPTMPCTSLESWHVTSPIMRGIRQYDSSFDQEFEPKTVARKRKRVSQHISRPITAEEIVQGRPSAMPINEEPDVVVCIDSNMMPKNNSVAKSLGF